MSQEWGAHDVRESLGALQEWDLAAMGGILHRDSIAAAAAASRSLASAEGSVADEHASLPQPASRCHSDRALERPAAGTLAASKTLFRAPSQQSLAELDQDLPQDQDVGDDDRSVCGSSMSGSPTVSDASSIRWAPQRDFAAVAARRTSVDTVSSMSSA